MKRVALFGTAALSVTVALAIVVPSALPTGSANRAPADAATNHDQDAPPVDFRYAANQAPPAPTTQEEQQKLIDAKAQAAQLAGVGYDPTRPVTVAQDQPVRTSVERLKMTREQLLAGFNESLKALEEQLAEVESKDGAEAANAIRAQITDDTMKQINSIPLEGITLDAPAFEVGHGSIQSTNYTHDGSSYSDPVNVIFGGPQGSAWDVNYDLHNWTSLRWECDTCDPPPWIPGVFCQGSTQWLWVWDAQHGGTDSWRAQSYGVQPVQDHCTRSPRFHMRIFNGGYDNHPGGFQEYSFGAAHWEDTSHNIMSWEAAEVLAQFSFRNLDGGGLIWFVSNIYYGQLYAGEWWRGHLNDGFTTYVILAY